MFNILSLYTYLYNSVRKWGALFAAVTALGLSACEDPVDIDLKTGPAQVTVEGWVYDTIYPMSVIFRTTAPYFINTDAPYAPIEWATITEDGTHTDTLYETPAGSGRWRPRKDYYGKTGSVYTLTFRYNGQTYTSTSKMGRVKQIDALVAFYRDKQRFGEDPGYSVRLNVPEPCGEGDFYRFKLYVNNLPYARRQDINIVEDRFVDGNYIADIEIAQKPLKVGDTLAYEILSIDEEGYKFFNEMQNQLFNGGLFARPPANVRTNVLNTNPNGLRATGYFGAAALARAEIIIKEKNPVPYARLLAGDPLNGHRLWVEPENPIGSYHFYPDGRFELIAGFTKCTTQQFPVLYSGRWTIDDATATLFLDGLPLKITRAEGRFYDVEDPTTGTVRKFVAP